MRLTLLGTLSLGCLLASACSPIYVAPSANAPLFGSGGELHGAAQLESLGGIDLQGAFSPFDHFGIQAGLSMLPEYDDDDHHRHYYGELGLGGYVPFGIGRFEAFAGAGYGKGWGRLETAADGTKVRGTGTYTRAYLQADIGLSTRVVDFGLMSRYSWVIYDYTDADGFKRTIDDPFIEEFLFFRIGYDPVKFELQTGVLWGADYEYQEIAWIPWHVSIGIHVKFDLWGGAGEEGAPAAADPPPADGGRQPVPEGFGRLW